MDTTIGLNEYQAKAKTTAIYPRKIDDIIAADGLRQIDVDAESALPPLLRLMYAYGGLMEEIAETVILVDRGPTPQGMTKELGDIAWYLAALSTELNCPLEKTFRLGVAPPMDMSASRLLLRMFMQSRELSGGLKRMIRDSNGELKDEDRTKLLICVGSMWRTLIDLTAAYMLDFGLVLRTNLEKLTSRQERGVISGKGDDR